MARRGVFQEDQIGRAQKSTHAGGPEQILPAPYPRSPAWQLRQTEDATKLNGLLPLNLLQRAARLKLPGCGDVLIHVKIAPPTFTLKDAANPPALLRHAIRRHRSPVFAKESDLPLRGRDQPLSGVRPQDADLLFFCEHHAQIARRER